MKRWMMYVLGIAVICIAGYMVWNNEEGKKREARVVAEYQAIKHPEGAKLVHYELNRKIIMRWIHSRYVYPISNDEVKQYYDQEFKGKGWQQTSRNLTPSDVAAYRYIKGNLELVLALKKDNSWTLFIGYMEVEY